TPPNPVAVMEARISFALRIRLGEHLLGFYRDVRHFPSWYGLKDRYPGQEPWASGVIPREAITYIKTSQLRDLGIEVPNYEHDEIMYRFSAAGKDYAFCARGDAVPDWIDDIEDEPSWTFSAFRAYVIELPSTLVLEDQ